MTAFPAVVDAEEADAAGALRGAYVHVPFCARLCPYCDFAVVVDADDQIDRYVAALLAEVAMEAKWDPLDTVYVGGGTPSRIDPSLVGAVVDALADRFGLAADVEVTIEANPEDWDGARPVALRAAGVNRVSMGAQSFDDAVLARLGRRHTAAQVRKAIASARASGIRSINLDLIFGDPGESVASWRNTVLAAIECGVDHVSTYALTVERGTALGRQVASGAPAPDEDDQAEKYELAVDLLAAAGYGRYEVANHARPGHACRHNLATWARGEYVAFGLGAHGHRGGVRRRNVRALSAYLTAVEGGRRPEAGADPVAGWDAEVERLMLGLRRTVGVWAGPGGVRLLASPEGRRLVEAGVLDHVGDRLVVRDPLRTDMVIRAALALPVLAVAGEDC